MSTTVESAFKRYNANSQDNSVGDCVKRALTYAYAMDYNEVGRQLNRIKGMGSYNSVATFTRFLKEKGAVKLGKEYTGMTEEEFCQKYPTGVYILLTGKESQGYSTHMVCIFNGDIIDSWNSSNYFVYDAWSIPNVDTTVHDVSYEDILKPLEEYIDKYLDSINKKYSSWFKIWREDGYDVNDLTYKMKFFIQTGPNLPDESSYYPNRKHTKRIVVKLNPRMSAEKNLESLQPKLKQGVYDWVYPFQKDMRDCQAIDTFENERYDKDRYGKKSLLKLPAWVRPYVTYFWWNEHNYSGYYNNYELKFKALPDDPYVEDRGDIIRIETESWKEMKDQLDAYKENFAREGYDY